MYFCLYVCLWINACLLPIEVRIWCWIAQNWSSRWLWGTVWVLRIEYKTSGRAVSVLNYWDIFPAQIIFFKASFNQKLNLHPVCHKPSVLIKVIYIERIHTKKRQEVRGLQVQPRLREQKLSGLITVKSTIIRKVFSWSQIDMSTMFDYL